MVAPQVGEEMQAIGTFFKKVLEDSKLSWAIYAAGIAAVLDILHVIGLASVLHFGFDRCGGNCHPRTN
jgi:hypothetical protein